MGCYGARANRWRVWRRVKETHTSCSRRVLSPTSIGGKKDAGILFQMQEEGGG